MKNSTSIGSFLLTLSPNRQLLGNKLLENDWFKNTNFTLQKELLTLPQDFESFIFDMSNRGDEIGDLDVLSLNKLLIANYLVIPIFEVRSNVNNQIFTYEYVSWKNGPKNGVKLTLFIEINGKIEYFVTKQIDKFSMNGRVYDSIAGFIQFSDKTLLNLPKNIENELKKHLGLEKITVDRFLDLGTIHTDIGLTNNRPGLVAAIIDGNNAKHLESIKGKRVTTKELSFTIDIVPIKELSHYVEKINDAYFLATVSRLLAKKVIEL